jgi:hypothetical protein
MHVFHAVGHCLLHVFRRKASINERGWRNLVVSDRNVFSLNTPYLEHSLKTENFKTSLAQMLQ